MPMPRKIRADTVPEASWALIVKKKVNQKTLDSRASTMSKDQMLYSVCVYIYTSMYTKSLKDISGHVRPSDPRKTSSGQRLWDGPDLM